ncbi:CDF family Co(II)/Ni(II) efflux transporter DmeF [Wenzhouxiangella sp. C33]|uniref:CDF family Co(II)/Ni(II) efflux transporter DmeF n=2 Tax=Wenzhouxiangella limi TaxID=2707351 RepID=A0A845V9G2_9GAMM|nr:CDF family Co(II)/Ni(II) efflux transporter DmeF [Wenzhouxiangella limi]NDY96781.1 CDF family Co(II)/Ni(II) efflux transporter DmeF [Wenzhouxiangella limi]
MHSPAHTEPGHSHTFGQDRKRPGENRTLLVIALTASMMVVEIVAGIAFGSMALLADGLHMASHAAALSITAVAYWMARRHAANPSFSFGTGKINALGGFTGALLLAGFALLMVWESLHRLINPVEIVFNQAILVAVVGLIVNGISVFILGVGGEEHDHHHHHDHHGASGHGHHHHDHNLRSAYLHVLADTLTSLLAIFALLAAKYFGAIWMDPFMGIIGAILVSRWSWGLVKSTSAVLLDRQAPDDLVRAIRSSVESDGDCRVTDLHVWSIGPGIHAAIIALVSEKLSSPDDYRKRLPEGHGLVHVSIEVCQAESRQASSSGGE